MRRVLRKWWNTLSDRQQVFLVITSIFWLFALCYVLWLFSPFCVSETEGQCGVAGLTAFNVGVMSVYLAGSLLLAAGIAFCHFSKRNGRKSS